MRKNLNDGEFPAYDSKAAIIFGVTGQIGSYMLDSLLDDGYIVYGVTRRVSNFNFERINHRLENPNFRLIEGDVTDFGSLVRVLNNFRDEVGNIAYLPEIYNFAASSHVATSFSEPGSNWDITGKGHLNLLEAVRLIYGCAFPVKVFFANSSETFGSQLNLDGFQCPKTPRVPNSPYAVAKLAAFNLNRIYRESYGLYCVGGTLFNTESERRGENFVTRKITKWFGQAAARFWDISKNDKLKLGNIFSYRDWTHAIDTVSAIRLMMKQPIPNDYIVASGQTHMITEFMELIFQIAKESTGICELGSIEDLYEIDEKLKRPNEVPYLRGDASLIRSLGWEPTISFRQLAERMFFHDFYGAT
jgi:GDPmannose 4,6-dehydratase